ncbi:MAG: hypothetical protein ACF8LL_02935 [Phycisphaerales bacterium]
MSGRRGEQSPAARLPGGFYMRSTAARIAAGLSAIPSQKLARRIDDAIAAEDFWSALLFAAEADRRAGAEGDGGAHDTV